MNAPSRLTVSDALKVVARLEVIIREAWEDEANYANQLYNGCGELDPTRTHDFKVRVAELEQIRSNLYISLQAHPFDTRGTHLEAKFAAQLHEDFDLNSVLEVFKIFN